MNLNLTKIEFKKICFRFVFVTQIIFFSINFFLGKGGFLFLRSFKKDNSALFEKIQKETFEVESLEKNISNWKNNSFLKEKVARENLQMAKPGDLIYILE